MRLAGVLLLFAALTAAGWMKSWSLKSRVTAAEALGFLLADCKALLRREDCPVYAVAARLAGRESYARLEFLPLWAAAMQAGQSPRDAFAGLSADRLTPEMRAAFLDFCDGLGKSDRAAQEALCDAYAAVFAKLKADCQAAYAEKGRLYRSLGLYAGAFVAVLFV